MIRRFTVAAVLLCAFGLFSLPRESAPAVGAEGETRTAVQNEHNALVVPDGPLEFPDDPPAPQSLLFQRQTSAATTVTRNGVTSVQVNIDAQGNNIVGDAANEPSIVVDPDDVNRIAIGWRQFDTIASNFRQAGLAYSQDGGQTWTFPGVLDPGQFRSDPVLRSDAAGNFYYSSLSSLTTVEVFKSTDGGVTWGAPVPAFGGDKQWIAVDRTSSIGSGNIYQTWNVQFSCCPPNDVTRSTDGGASFEGPFAVPTPSMKWGTMDVAADGTLYLAGATLNQAGHLVARSTNAKDPAQTPAFDFVQSVNLGGATSFGGPNPAGLLGQVWLAVDRSTGPTGGHVYVLGSVDPPGTDPLDVMFIRSSDGGSTWSAPVRVTDDPVGNNAWQWFGTMSVAPNGRIDVVWNDSRNTGSGNLAETFYAFSTDGGTTWSPNRAISPAWNSLLGFPNQDKIGDYYDMFSDHDAAYLAYATTFNGEQDVYFARIVPALPFEVEFPDGTPRFVPTDTPVSFRVRATDGFEQVDPSSAVLHVSTGGPFEAFPLLFLGGEEHEATLPGAPCGGILEFFVSFQSQQGRTISLPSDAPQMTRRAIAAAGVAFALQDDFENDLGWTVTNDATLTEGAWERGVPAGDGSRGDPVEDFDGSGRCYLTDNRPGNSDVDGGATTLASPPLDAAASDAAVLRYARWYSNDAGGAAGTDFWAVQITGDGINWVTVENTNVSSRWVEKAFRIQDFVPLTDQFQVRYIASDFGTASVVEAAVDAVEVINVSCEAGGCLPAAAPVAETTVTPKNRYLSFRGGNAGRLTAVRIEFVELPGDFAALNGTQLWVGEPQPISQSPNKGLSDPVDPGEATVTVAPLQCTPFFTDWSLHGTVHAFHELVVPGARYHVTAIDQSCDPSSVTNFSPPLSVATSRFGDTAGPFSTVQQAWTSPDSLVQVATDVIALIDALLGRSVAPIKPRADLMGFLSAAVDGAVRIGDVLLGIDAALGKSYPFPPGAPPCP